MELLKFPQKETDKEIPVDMAFVEQIEEYLQQAKTGQISGGVLISFGAETTTTTMYNTPCKQSLLGFLEQVKYHLLTN